MPRDLTYDDVGATAPADVVWRRRPPHLRTFERTVIVGRGDDTWQRVADVLMRWGIKTRSGFTVDGNDRPGAVQLGAEHWITASVGPLTIHEPVQIVAVVDELDRCGFAYGTLEGHPVSGEEAFILHRHGDKVSFTLRSVTSPGRGRWRLVFPAILVAQRAYRRRYLRSLLD